MFCGDRSVEYHCNPGYALSGNSEADCTQNGWSPQPPQCLNINECQRNNGKITNFYARFSMYYRFKYIFRWLSVKSSLYRYWGKFWMSRYERQVFNFWRFSWSSFNLKTIKILDIFIYIRLDFIIYKYIRYYLLS